MSVTKKKTTRKREKKATPTVVVVTKTYHKKGETLFPQKVSKVKEVLSKANFNPL